MQFTFFGTGTSQGVPMIGCNCEVCQSTDPRDNRLRASGLLRDGQTSILFDAGPDFRCQILRSGAYDFDAILLTHEHYDHVGGLDDVRSVNYATKKNITVYGDDQTCAAVRKNLFYVFKENPYPGVPKIDLIEHKMQPFQVGEAPAAKKSLEVIPFEVMHGKLPITGYRIGRFAYITDASFLSEETFKTLAGVEVLVINALRFREHMSHFSLDESLEAIAKIGPKRAYLTHFCHEIGLHDDFQKKLPEGVYAGYDGLTFEI